MPAWTASARIALTSFDGVRPVPVEVAGEQRVRAAQLARPALRAVHVVVGDVLDRQVALPIATTLAWNAVGEWFSFCVTCVTGQTSRQNLWPELKQP